jgi:hypothetical protein
MTKNKLISGLDLKRLPNILGCNLVDVHWLFGYSSPRWLELIKSPEGTFSARHSIVIRAILRDPDISPIPSAPTLQELLDLIQSIDPSFTEVHLPILLGMEPAARARLLDPNEDNTRVVTHYALMIRDAINKQLTADGKRKKLQFFKDLANEEAESRGVDLETLWEKGGWNKGAIVKSKIEEHKIEQAAAKKEKLKVKSKK